MKNLLPKSELALRKGPEYTNHHIQQQKSFSICHGTFVPIIIPIWWCNSKFNSIYNLISGSKLGAQGTSNNCVVLMAGAAYMDQGQNCGKLFDMECSYKSAKSICEL